MASDLDDVLRRGALGALHDVELDRRALGETAESVSLNGGVMHEAIVAAALGLAASKVTRLTRGVGVPAGSIG